MKEALSQTLSQKLQQRLSPMQVQFVRLLEMNGAEIEEEVRRAVDENPALEATDSHSEDDETDPDEASFNETAEQLQMADYRSEDDMPVYTGRQHGQAYDEQWREPVAVASGDTLQQYLLSQLASQTLTSRQMTIGEYIIGNIDDNGYLARSFNALLDDIAIQGGLEITDDELAEMIARVRDLDPAGVGATDLRDCLLLQLKRRKTSVSIATAREIISNYFDLFSHKHYDRLMAALEIDEPALKAAIEEIRSLNPKPGIVPDENWQGDTTSHITPDFSVETDGESLTLTSLNNLPHLNIESTFDPATIESTSADTRHRREAMTFVRRKYDEASTFIRALSMRQETLHRVMSAIVKWQNKFFLTDDETQLRPMILKDIAAMTGYDISVISRATAGKYVATRSGIYPLKFFFNERPSESADTSTHEILAAIRDIIDHEDKKKPFSDEAITAQLVAKGYPVARRTVAKYRERLGIPVARLRKDL